MHTITVLVAEEADAGRGAPPVQLVVSGGLETGPALQAVRMAENQLIGMLIGEAEARAAEAVGAEDVNAEIDRAQQVPDDSAVD